MRLTAVAAKKILSSGLNHLGNFFLWDRDLLLIPNDQVLINNVLQLHLSSGHTVFVPLLVLLTTKMIKRHY